MILTIITFILILSFLVFVHEFGHYFAALKFGMKVEEFAIGMGPMLYKRVSPKTGIIYSLRAIPIGGFCKIKGEDGSRDEKDESGEVIKKINGDSFGDKKIWQRAIVLASGVFMNFLIAFVFIYIGLISGFPTIIDEEFNYGNAKISGEKIKIYSILEKSNAEKNGLKSGSTVISIDDITFKNAKDIHTYISNKDSIKIKIENDNKDQEILLTKEISGTESKALFGFTLEKIGFIRYNIIRAIPESAKTLYSFVLEMLNGLSYLFKSIFTGKGVPDEVGGPIGIAVVTGSVIKNGFLYIIQFIALLSLNLAIINIIPFPALDGGRLLFLIFEKIKGKHLNENFEIISNFVGFGLLMLLIIAVTFKDVFTFILHK